MDSTNLTKAGGVVKNKEDHTMKKCTVIGIDLTKNVIQICKIGAYVELIYNKDINPNRLREILAITIASTQTGMVFSLVKSIEQQSLQTLEKSRKFLDKEVTQNSQHSQNRWPPYT